MLARLERAESEGAQCQTIVVVAEEPDVADLLSYILEPDHYNVVPAASGPEALEFATHHDVHLVVSEIDLPVMTGYQLSRALQSRLKTSFIPVLLIVRGGEHYDPETAFQTSVRDHLDSPFSHREFRNRVHHLAIEPQPTPVADSINDLADRWLSHHSGPRA